MTLTQLNAKIDASHCDSYSPSETYWLRLDLRYYRDERLGILCGNAEPTEEQVQIVHDQLFGPEPQKNLL